MISVYLADIIILLIAAVIIVPLFQTAKLGAVPGFVVAGIIVGPSGLGLISTVEEIKHLAEIGVVLLLFVIGIELKPSRLWLMRRYVFGLGTLQVIVAGALLGLISYFIFENPLRSSILIGPALALSSTAFVLQILTEQKLLTSLYGRASISVLLLQDLAVVPLLALVPLLSLPELNIGGDIGFALVESLVIVTLVVVIGRFFLHPILHRVALAGNPEIFTATAVLIVLGTALVTEYAGLSMAMGAFLAGLMISDSFYRHQILAEIQPFRGLLLGLFFMSMGMALNVDLFTKEPLFFIFMTALLLAVKAAILFPICYLFGLKFKNSLAVALILAQSGEFALVLFSLARINDLMAPMLFQQLLLIVLLSMIATPALAQIAKRLVHTEEASKTRQIEEPEEAPIVITGFGRVGHRIGEMLTSAGKQFVALDSNASIVERERENGHPVFFGDARQAELLKAAGANNADVFVVTLNDPVATEAVVSSLLETYPNVKVYARGNSLSQCKKLYELGASGVVSENIEASIELARMTLKTQGFSDHKTDIIIENFRKAYNCQMVKDE